MNDLLQDALNKCRHYTQEGKVANYIPELAKANIEHFGICVIENDKTYCAGDYNVPFTLQSIIKPIILLLALSDVGMERVRSLVGVEATGKPFDAFNYSDQALNADHINPMINTGAMALATLIKGSSYKEKFDRLMHLTKILTGNPTLAIDEKVYLSEKATGDKNRALAYMLKAYGMITDDIDELTNFYFRACSIQATCKDLANVAFVLSHKGKDLLPPEYVRYTNAVLTICGMYDGSGEFALNVGVPAKSGVGGGIMAIIPNRMGIGIYSPSLDKKGNSIAGVKVLELLSKQLNLSIF